MKSRHSQPRASPPCPQVHVGQGIYSSDTSQNCDISASPSAAAALRYPHMFPGENAQSEKVRIIHFTLNKFYQPLLLIKYTCTTLFPQMLGHANDRMQMDN